MALETFFLSYELHKRLLLPVPKKLALPLHVGSMGFAVVFETI